MLADQNLYEMTGFKGAAKRLDKVDIPRIAYRINSPEDHLRAFLHVEARARGFDSKGRPIMLFEPHVFWRNLPVDLRGRAESLGLAYRSWGEKPYPADSYDRLIRAIEIDQDAALKACSIGMSQVLVENFASLGFRTPEDMWLAFMDDEEVHIETMVRFMIVNDIDDDVRHGRWLNAVRVYNGPGHAKHNYVGRIKDALTHYKGVPDVDWWPDGPDVVFAAGEQLEAVQKTLRDSGYPEVGKPDGFWGPNTRAAVLAYRDDNGLPIKAEIDAEFLALLLGEPDMPVPTPPVEEVPEQDIPDFEDALLRIQDIITQTLPEKDT